MTSYVQALVIMVLSALPLASLGTQECTVTTVVDWATQPVQYGEETLSAAVPEAAEPAVFNHPQTLLVNSDGLLYVPDPVNKRILVFDASGKYQKSLALGKESKDKRQSYIVQSMAMDAEGNVYILNEASHDIEVYSNRGRLVQRVPHVPVGVEGLGVGKDGNIYLFGMDPRVPLEVLGKEGRVIPRDRYKYDIGDLLSYTPYRVLARTFPGRTQFTLLRNKHVIATCVVDMLMSEDGGTYLTREGVFYFFAFDPYPTKDLNVVKVIFKTGNQQ